MTFPEGGVLIVGAGPVGLFLGCRLAVLGIPVRLLEQRLSGFAHSRSVGIHPPGLEALATAGVAERLLENGARISHAQVYSRRELLGVLSLGSCPAPYRFVLTLPQSVTETVLAQRLEELAPGALQRDCKVIGLRQDSRSVTLELSGGTELQAALVIGCDGRNSMVRRLMGLPARVAKHVDAYVMADVADGSSLGSCATIHLTDSGVVESFPLPDGQRRWVARVTSPVPGAGAELELLGWLVRERTGFKLPDSAVMVSGFNTETLLCSSLVRGRVLLAGDAAHVIPPIGGQGLNLGWLGAERLARRIAAKSGAGLEAYSREQLQSAKRAARRAQLNMRLGRGWQRPALRDALLRRVLAPPFAPAAARFFTMRGL